MVKKKNTALLDVLWFFLVRCVLVLIFYIFFRYLLETLYCSGLAVCLFKVQRATATIIVLRGSYENVGLKGGVMFCGCGYFFFVCLF